MILEKLCQTCNLVKPAEEFFIRRDRKSGLQSDCKTCKKLKNLACQKKYRDRNKRKAIEYLGGKCCHCGLVTEHHSVYDFHHLDRAEKDFNPSKVMNCKWEKVEKEILKCILLCANCHRIEHGS